MYGGEVPTSTVGQNKATTSSPSPVLEISSELYLKLNQGQQPRTRIDLNIDPKRVYRMLPCPMMPVSRLYVFGSEPTARATTHQPQFIWALEMRRMPLGFQIQDLSGIFRVIVGISVRLVILRSRGTQIVPFGHGPQAPTAARAFESFGIFGNTNGDVTDNDDVGEHRLGA